MNKTFLTIIATGMALATSLLSETQAATSVKTSSLLKVERLEVLHLDSILQVSFDIDPHRLKPGSDRQVTFTPILRSKHNAKDTVALKPITFAGRNRYYTHLREGDMTAGDLIYQAGKKSTVEYIRTTTWQPWMSNCEVIMREETQNCCRPVTPLCDTPIADIGTSEEDFTNMLEEIDYVALTGDSAVVLEAEGKAYIDFVVNRTEIKDNYRRNPIELKKIIESIDLIKNDPDASITRLSIKGFASPEGNYDNNVRLSIGRTEALKEYVRKRYSFDPKIMHTNYEPEDWDGLREWLLQSNIPNRDAILEIVNSGMAPDPKDAEIKRLYSKQYKLLLDSVYPGLRHSDYKVEYRIKTYQDIDELKQAYAKTPERLRPVDFFRIAETFPTGSQEYEEVLLKASEIYPHNQEAAVNAANILLRRGDIEGASIKSVDAGESGEAYFTRGMIAQINGDIERAEFFFRKSLELGVGKANERLQTIERLKNPETITYLIEVKNK